MSIALGIQYALHIRRTIIRGQAVHYFTTLIKKTIFEKRKLLKVECVFWFSLQLFVWVFLVVRRNDRCMIKNIYWSSCKAPCILPDFNETWIFSTDFRKACELQISWNSVHWEQRYFMRAGRTDGRRVLTKLTVAFRNFESPLRILTMAVCVVWPTGKNPRCKDPYNSCLVI